MIEFEEILKKNDLTLGDLFDESKKKSIVQLFADMGHDEETMHLIYTVIYTISNHISSFKNDEYK